MENILLLAAMIIIYISDGSDVNTVDISDDGNFLVAGTDNMKVLLFNNSSNETIWSYNTSGAVYSVAINSNGNYIAAGGSDNTTYFFERSSSTPLWNHTTGDEIGDNDHPHCIDISADGDYIAVGSNDYHIYVFEKSSGIPLWNYTTGGIIHAVAMSADGAYITTGGDDNQIYLLFQDLTSGSPASISFGYWFILFTLPTFVALIFIRRRSYKNK
jgi:WD40 repeat protein